MLGYHRGLGLPVVPTLVGVNRCPGQHRSPSLIVVPTLVGVNRLSIPWAYSTLGLSPRWWG